MSTIEVIQEILADIVNIPDLQLESSTTARDVPGWDSLAHISLVSALESQFLIRFALGELQSLKNVGDMVAIIDSKKA